jgi:hypothetical protein
MMKGMYHINSNTLALLCWRFQVKFIHRHTSISVKTYEDTYRIGHAADLKISHGFLIKRHEKVGL